ncbi:MAG: 3,4-dihydroxy-2-butanone-4-phosphate synthase, partial [Xanthobacteraceae bacterium]
MAVQDLNPPPARTEGKEQSVSDTHQRVEEAVAAFKRGEIVVVADDGDREDEGDLFI